MPKRFPLGILETLFDAKRYFDSIEERNDSFIHFKIEVDTHPGGYAEDEYPYRVIINNHEAGNVEIISREFFKTEREAFKLVKEHLEKFIGD